MTDGCGDKLSVRSPTLLPGGFRFDSVHDLGTF
jgi:hypothetical protein